MLLRLLFNREDRGDVVAGAFGIVCEAVEVKTDDFRIGATGALRPFISGNDGGAPPLKTENKLKLLNRKFYFESMKL